MRIPGKPLSSTFLLGKINESEELIKKKNIFLNYKKETQNSKNNNNIQPYIMNHTLNKVSDDNTNNNLMNVSTTQNEDKDNKEKEDDNNYTIRKKIKQMTGNQIRDEKKKLSNITTTESKNKKRGSFSVPKPFPFRILIHKHGMPLEERIARRRRKNNLSLLMNRTKLYNISHNSNNKVKKFNFISNKNLETLLFRGKTKNIGIETIKQSLNNKIATMPSNKKVAQQLYEFINNSKKYEVKKIDIYKKSMHQELLELKEDMKNVANYHELIKKVDFSDVRRFSPKSNHKVTKKDKGSSINLAFSFKTRLEKNVPIKEFLKNLEIIKEKEREKKFIKFIRSNFKKNNRHIHNLTVSLEHIKKKYNY